MSTLTLVTPMSPLHPQVSITFDPFLYLPVPLPQKQKVLPIYYFAREPHSKPIKVSNNPLPLAVLKNMTSYPFPLADLTFIA